MREILFRGRRVDNGEWVEGWYYKRLLWPDIIVDAIQVYDGKSLLSMQYHAVILETIGQYTGLIDKNGKRIFEGDIVKAADTDDADLVGEIVLNMCSWLVSGSNWSDTLFRANEVHALEAIGNIHDNPELLAEVEG